MHVSIHDHDALSAVSPAALAAYARTAGWKRHESYREHSEVYVGDTLPEIIIPLTVRLGDYASVVAALIGAFAKAADQDELTVYRALVTADRDIVRIRAGESDDGSLGLNDGVSLIGGARDLVLSAACSLYGPRPVYRAGANREAADLLSQMRLGQTDQGSFAVTLLTPVIPPQMSTLFEDLDDPNAPIARQTTKRLAEALAATRQVAERTVAGDEGTFNGMVDNGVSANLCEALVKLAKPFSTLDVGVSWARTRPAGVPDAVVRFGQSDAPLLREAARSLRERAPKPDVILHGFVRILERGEEEAEGRIRLRAQVDGQMQSVTAVLEREDYGRAVQAHKERAPVALKGDLERVGQRWKLLNPRIEGVLLDDGEELGVT